MPRKITESAYSAGFEEFPVPRGDVGKSQMIPELVDAMKNMPFLLCGPPGCGKKSLIYLAALKMEIHVEGVYDLGHIANEQKVIQDQLERVLAYFGSRIVKN
jgi:replication-associated recombination protein RarA